MNKTWTHFSKTSGANGQNQFFCIDGKIHWRLPRKLKKKYSKLISHTGEVKSYSFWHENKSGIFRNLMIDCKVASLAIYNRALTKDEVLQNFNALKDRFKSYGELGDALNKEGLTAFYEMNETDGERLDSHNNNNLIE